MTAIDRKRALREELARVLEEELRVATAAQRATQQAATHAEAKPENDKDTRALEQSYLARGQAMRVDELTAGLAEVGRMPVRALGEDAAVTLGALVHVADDDDHRVYLLAPHGGGTKLEGGAVQVVTPKSPLGRALVGKRAGDESHVVVAGKTRELSIDHVE